jgi:hypothetical protein
MSFNGSGTYSLPGAALNTGDTVSATENNTLRNDMATAFNKTLCRDGQATPTANLPMGGFKHTGLAAGTTAGDSVRFEQLPSGSNVLAEGSGGTGTTVGHNGFKNRIINGAMVIDQRNAGASVTQAVQIDFPVDRFSIFGSVTSKFTAQQNAGSLSAANRPIGFTNYLGITSSSAYSVGASELFVVRELIEGFNVSDFGWGTGNASTATLSFWVRSSLTGTFGGAFRNSDGSRSYPFSYTISSANTWEQKTVTVAGDTSGTWLTTNGVGLQVVWGLGCGSSVSGTAGTWSGSSFFSATGAISVVGTSGATFYITGVQLEKGSTATSFDYRPYGTELSLCQRYYERMSDVYYGTGYANSTTQYESILRFAIEKRATPAIANSGTFVWNIGAGNVTASALSADSPSTKSVLIYKSGLSGFVAGTAGRFANSSNSYIEISSEL